MIKNVNVFYQFQIKSYCKCATEFHIPCTPFSDVKCYMLTRYAITAYYRHPNMAQAHRQGSPLWKIYVNISSETANKSAEILVAEKVQEKDQEDLIAEVVDALDLENSETDMFQLGGYYN